MGLDLVEIYVSIENEFNIDLLEDSVSKIETVGDLVDYVEAAVGKDGIPEWKAKQILSESLSRVKHELAAALKIPESAISPNDRLDKLIPVWRRRRIWNSSPFFSEIGSLGLGCGTIFILYLLFVAGFVAICVGWCSGEIHFGPIFRKIGPFFGGVLSLIALILVFRGIFALMPRLSINSQADTVMDCARKIAAKEGVHLNKAEELWTREQIERRVLEIISDQAGIKLDQLKLELHLVKDLNLG